MKIGINGRFLIKPDTGIGQYSIELLKALGEIAPENKYFVAIPEAVNLSFPVNVKLVVIPEASFPSAGMKKFLWEQFQIGKFFQNFTVDCLHGFYPSNPRFLFKKPVIVTVHDTIPWENPAYTPGLLSRLYHRNSLNALEKADHIITVSDTVKNRLRKFLKTPKDVSVIHNAAGEIFRHPIAVEEIDAVWRKHDLSNPFILYVGGYDERKNVRLLIDAYLAEIATNLAIDLVLAGKKNHESALYESYDYKAGEDFSSFKGKIRRIGRAPQNELAALYRSCECFVHLSADEGFNIPLLEAAYSGCAIIASDIAVHREVLRDSAEYTSIDTASKIGLKIKELLTNPSLKINLKKSASAIAQKYSWLESAKKTLEIYKNVLCPPRN